VGRQLQRSHPRGEKSDEREDANLGAHLQTDGEADSKCVADVTVCLLYTS